MIGITRYAGTARGPSAKEGSVSFLVESRAAHILLQTAKPTSKKLASTREQACTPPDGARVQMSIAETYLVLNQSDTHTPIMVLA